MLFRSNSHGGGMAEYTVVDAAMLHRLPDGVDLRLGALVEPMAVAWHAVGIGEAQPGETALIAGAGPIGVGVWFALREHGVDRVIVSEPNAERRSAIAGLGVRVIGANCGRGVDEHRCACELLELRPCERGYRSSRIGHSEHGPDRLWHAQRHIDGDAARRWCRGSARGISPDALCSIAKGILDEQRRSALRVERSGQIRDRKSTRLIQSH